MTDWKERLVKSLEPILRSPDPRPQISMYHDMPYAIFLYPPKEEFAARSEISLLKIRLEQVGKRVTTISLAECLASALQAEGMSTEQLVQAETAVGIGATVETVHEVLSSYQPLDDVVVSQLPPDSDPLRDIVFITRAGALFPVYRPSSLLEQLKGRLNIPGVLYYPGERDGAVGLRFMGVLDAEHNYRVKIF